MGGHVHARDRTHVCCSDICYQVRQSSTCIVFSINKNVDLKDFEPTHSILSMYH